MPLNYLQGKKREKKRKQIARGNTTCFPTGFVLGKKERMFAFLVEFRLCFKERVSLHHTQKESLKNFAQSTNNGSCPWSVLARVN